MKHRLRNTLLLGGVFVALSSAFFCIPAPLDPVQASASLPKGQALVERGRYLATAADCSGCHTAQGGKPFAGGRPFVLPFGTLTSSNITPDQQNGIGAWSDAEFVRAVRKGVSADGRELYPAFPYVAYSNMSTDDILAIRAYLKTLAPVAAAAPPNNLSFPFNLRFLIRGWKLISVRSSAGTSDPSKSGEWNRGAYLVEGAGHCGDCHTPRNIFFAPKRNEHLGGAVVQGWKTYNITSDEKFGVGGWSIDELARYLGTGHVTGRGTASGSMAEAISLSLSQLTPNDLRAIAVYLKTVPAVASEGPPSVKANVPPSSRATAYDPGINGSVENAIGVQGFAASCASCHGWNGEGLQADYASLRGARTVIDGEATNVVQVILRGSKISTKAETVSMPSFARTLSDAEIAAVSNFLISNFGGKEPSVTPAQVARARAQGE